MPLPKKIQEHEIDTGNEGGRKGAVLQIGLPDKLLICRKCREAQEREKEGGQNAAGALASWLQCSLKSLIKVNKKIRGKAKGAKGVLHR